MAPDTVGIGVGETQLYMRVKRKDLKWYQKFWNVIAGHKERNWKWVPIKKGNL